jgi:hypothetical protein
MKEISLNILDIAENSVKAGATLTEITVNETNEILNLIIKDNGCGMSEEILASVTNPFYTTRTTRKVGLGIPLLKLACEQTGGKLTIVSKTASEGNSEHGTCVEAVFIKNHLDCTPLGDVISTVVTLIQGHPDRDFLFRHKNGNGEVMLDTREMRAVLGEVSLAEFEVLSFVKAYLNEQYELIQQKIN